MKKVHTMKKQLMLLALAAACAVSPMAVPTEARTASPLLSDSSKPFRYAPESSSLAPQWKSQVATMQAKLKARSVKTDADFAFAPSDNFSFLQLPDGTSWYIIADTDKNILSQNEYYTEYSITGVHATIYDDDFRPVGKIDHTVETPEGYGQCTNLSFGLVVTKKFFNTDDNYEVMLMLNYRPAEGYGAQAFTYVYSLRGAETSAVFVQDFKGYYTTAVNDAKDSWSENFFMTFFTGETQTDDELFHGFDIYTKASYASPRATLLKHFDIDMVHVMSDGANEGMPVLINSKGSNLYVAVGRYEKTFFKNPFDFMDDTLNPDNHFLIDLYTLSGYPAELKLAKQTSIPVDAPAEGFAMRTYSLGMFQGSNDISFDFSASTLPDYVLSVVDSDFRDNSAAHFEVITPDGTSLGTFGHGNDGFMSMADVPGQSRQFVFLCYNEDGTEGIFRFMDYPSMQEVASIPVLATAGNEIVKLSTDVDRVAAGGSYSYVFSGALGDHDADGNTIHEVLWFDKDGNHQRTDRLNAGKNVNRVQVYVAGHALDPYLFNTDVKQEYMILVQRQDNDASAASHVEFCVVNPNGETLVQYKFASTASEMGVWLVNPSTRPAVGMGYSDFSDKLYHVDMMSLPLNKFEGEGTAENPYLLYTPGDVLQIKNNLSSHFRLAADIDYRGAAFTPIAGAFSGSIDGAGHSIKNFTLADKPMFADINGSEEKKASVRDLTLWKPVVSGDASAVLANRIALAELEGVHVYKLSAISDSSDDFGGLVCTTGVSCAITGCSVSGDIQREGTVGGIVCELGNGSAVSACSFSGTIKADAYLGGIAMSTTATSTLTDCHVNATLEARNNIGGIVANSGRGLISRCVAEGEITATEAGRTYSEKDGMIQVINVGGIVGSLTPDMGGYDDFGNPTEPGTAPVVKDCLVALAAITIPDDNEALLATAHRIVGRSRINYDPQYLGEEYDEDLEDWVITWGDPQAPENCLVNNHAVNVLGLLDPSVAADAATTEGATKPYDEIDGDFFDSLSFSFNGYSAGEPWVFGTNLIPQLWFESTVGRSLSFEPAAISVTAGEKAQVLLVAEGVSIDALTVECSDESGCMPNLVDIAENGFIMEVDVLKEGTYTITASAGTVKATLAVTGLSGIHDAVADASSISFDGATVFAAGSQIAVYSVAGVAVAGGSDAVGVSHLAPGIYVAVATDASGTRSTLKIAVK